MDGITDLSQLLASMSPELSAETFVFLSLNEDAIPEDLKTWGTIREQEGVTLICDEQEALKFSIEYNTQWKRITLSVHSSLEAVGFLNAITEELAQAGISCNVISAYYHDHLFVLATEAKRALDLLKTLNETHSSELDNA